MRLPEPAISRKLERQGVADDSPRTGRPPAGETGDRQSQSRGSTSHHYSSGPAAHARPIERVADCTRGARWTSDTSLIAPCTHPDHDDRRPSMTVDEGFDGRVLIHCHSRRCDIGGIVAGMGLEVRDLFPPGDKWKRTTPRSTVNRHARAPKPKAADCLQLVDMETWLVQVIAGALARGEALTDGMVDDLQRAARRIHAIRSSWELA